MNSNVYLSPFCYSGSGEEPLRRGENILSVKQQKTYRET